MKYTFAGLALAVLLAALTSAQPAIDGSAADVLYGAALVIQDTQTGFGDASLGRPDIANGSELDAGYATIYQNTLYVVLAGNLQNNGNKLELFFDTRAGGQNRLLATNPGQPNTGLLRMCDDGSGNGLRFDTGFDADFWVSVSLFGTPPTVYVDYAELWVDAQHPGVGYFVGSGQTVCSTNNGELTGGDPNAPAIRCTIDNSNIAGVSGGFGLADGSGVLTGVELAIPLSAIGAPAGSFRICTFVNGQQHDFVSNQILGGIFGTVPNNLGEPRAVDFSTIFGNQFFTVSAATAPVGACCHAGACAIDTQAHCGSTGGTYKGDNTNCDGNPCDAVASGRCCIDDGFSGQCLIRTAAECAALGGSYGGDNTTCAGCPCLLAPKGACCTSAGCQLLTQAACTAANGTYVGDFTNCNNAPCDMGACCTNGVCTEVRQFECVNGGGRFIGAGTTCAAGLCDFTISTPFSAGDFQSWCNNCDAMTETPAGSHIYLRSYTAASVGRHEWKVTDGTWNNTIPSGPNSWLFTDPNGDFTLTYDANFYADGWKPDRDRLGLSSDPGTWTATGDFLHLLGGSDWNNADPHGMMTAQGGGVYKLETTLITPGTYAWKAVVTGSWDSISVDGRSVNTANFSFTVDTASTVQFWVDNAKGRVKVEIIPTHQTCRGDLNCDGHINFGDINPFVLALSDFQTWQHTYGSQSPLQCPDANADVNNDGHVDFGDINPFVALLSGGRDCPNP